MQVSKLKQMLRYDESTGDFFWLVNVSNVRAGTKAGYTNKRGYVVIKALGKLQYAHRIAWAFAHGDPPAKGVDIDHVNQMKHDNRISNLRVCNRSQNQANISRNSNNKSGRRGVFFCERLSKYIANIRVNYRTIHIGVFTSIAEASNAREDYEKKYFGEFAPSAP